MGFRPRAGCPGDLHVRPQGYHASEVADVVLDSSYYTMYTAAALNAVSSECFFPPSTLHSYGLCRMGYRTLCGLFFAGISGLDACHLPFSFYDLPRWPPYRLSHLWLVSTCVIFLEHLSLPIHLAHSFYGFKIWPRSCLIQESLPGLL